MRKLSSVLLLAMFLFSSLQSQVLVRRIPDSDAIDLARIIARDEGYDLGIQTIEYSFIMARDSQCKPLVFGYTSVIFNIDASARNLIGINDSTGQAIEMNTCEVFDYPNVIPFQKQTMRINRTKRKTAQELADDVDCGIPKILTKQALPTKRK